MEIEVGGNKIHYDLAGSGPWLTLSHPLGCNLNVWDAQLPALTPHFTVLRYDTRGHGATDAPRSAYTLEQLADDAYGLLQALGINRTHWLGLSMGSLIGQTFALRYPDTLHSLILAGTTSRYPAAAIAKVFAERIRNVEEHGMAPQIEPALARWFTTAFIQAQPQVMQRIADQIRATPTAGYIGCCHAIPKLNLTERLKEITCPVLVIAGAEDPGTTVTMAREIYQALPGAQLVVLPQASHLSNIEQQSMFNAALRGFLSGKA